MKIKNLKISIKSREEALEKFARTFQAVRQGKPVERIDEISFPNVATFRRVFTQRRMELLHLIRLHNPKSIYELAKIAKRDLKSVNKDLQVLRDLEIISTQKTNEGRNQVRPHVDFDKINLEIAI